MKTFKLIYYLLAMILLILSIYIGQVHPFFNKIALGIFISICGFTLYLIIFYAIPSWIKSFKKD